MSTLSTKPVLVEWVDSAQPIPGWRLTSTPPISDVVHCQSVGWIVSETDEVLMLVPNVGNLGLESEQGSGFIRIPIAAITRRAQLVEAA